MAFTGIPAEAFDFYDSLKADNSKAFWERHKTEYQDFVREPLQELAAEISPDFGPAKLFRPYRDVRFSKDKTPYKDHQGLFVDHSDGVGWYAQVSSAGLMVAGGWYSGTSNQVQRFRQTVADDDSNALAAILDEVASHGLEVDGIRLKTQPRGISPDHPRLDLLRYKTLYAQRRWEPQAWMGTRKAVTVITDTFNALTPMVQWLAAAVGPA